MNSVKVPPVPFTVRMHDISNLDHYDVKADRLYTVVEVLALSESLLGYKLLEIEMPTNELFDAKRFAIYTISSPN